MSVANFKHCEGVFRAYMADKYSMRIPADGEAAAQAKRALYRVMDDLQHRHDRGELDGAATRLKDLNNLALNATRDVLMRERTSPPSAPPAPLPLANRQQQQAPTAADRDRDVYGERRVVAFRDRGLLPTAVDVAHPDVARSFDAVAASRRAEAEPAAPPPPWEAPAPAEEAIAEDDFKRRIADLERQRAEQAQVSRDLLPPPPGTHDGAAVQRAALRDQDEFREMQQRAAAEADAGGPIGNERASTVIPPPPRQRRVVLEKYLSLNGADRDCDADPHRYRFSVAVRGYDSGDLSQSHRNIEWIEATCVVLPMEAELPAGSSRGFFQHDFGLQYPYLLLAMDGFEGTYDATNDAARRAFCMLRYRRGYRAPNGRGYVVLEPMQAERRVFTPAPLASLRQLRVSVQRPNGTLFNNSVDRYLVSTLEYDPVQRLYLHLVLDRYYDANEFVPGDTVTIAGFQSAAPVADVDPNAFGALDTFLNRPEGHEVVCMGPANDQGFARVLLVLAPGVLDQAAGTVVLDGRIIRAVQQLADASVPASVARPGRLLNASLQCVVALRLGERAGDATSFADDG